MQPAQRRHPIQATHPRHWRIRTDRTVRTLPATAALPTVAIDPAIAALPTVAIDPAIAALAVADREPTTATELFQAM
jgi:hypothetical protein